jgi:hypothetical protein
MSQSGSNHLSDQPVLRPLGIPNNPLPCYAGGRWFESRRFCQNCSRHPTLTLLFGVRGPDHRLFEARQAWFHTWLWRLRYCIVVVTCRRSQKVGNRMNLQRHFGCLADTASPSAKDLRNSRVARNTRDFAAPIEMPACAAISLSEPSDSWRNAIMSR